MRAVAMVYLVEACISFVGAVIVSWAVRHEDRSRSWCTLVPFVVLASALWFLVWPALVVGYLRHAWREPGRRRQE